MDTNFFLSAMEAVGLKPIVIDETTIFERKETMDDMCEICEDEIATIECPNCGLMMCDLCSDEHECISDDDSEFVD